MTSHEIILRNTETGAEQTLASGDLAEGETIRYDVVVENPRLAGSANESSGSGN